MPPAAQHGAACAPGKRLCAGGVGKFANAALKSGMSDSRSAIGAGGASRIAAELLIMAAIGLALGALGPFGSYQLPLASRLGFWVGFILLGYAIFRPMLIFRGTLGTLFRMPPIAADLLILTVGAFPLAALIGWALAWPRPAHLNETFATLYLQVWAIGLAIDLLMVRLIANRVEDVPPIAAPEPAPAEPSLAKSALASASPSAFAKRLPPSFGARLHCLRVEDHYVRAYGDGGSTLLLMRLRDAVEELGEAGMQVHRSWWVARDSVARVERDGRAL
jgi:hypothetical protein